MHTDLIPPSPSQSFLRNISAVLRRWDWPTLCVFSTCLGVFGATLALPPGWAAFQWVVFVLVLTLHSSLSHEILHGHPFGSEKASTVLGLMQPGLFVPYLRFKALHLAHHRDANLTDPYDDPESNYLDPEIWAGLALWKRRVLTFNNTLFGRMMIGPFIGMKSFVAGDLQRIMRGEREVALHWLAHLPGVMFTIWLVSLSAMPVWSYLLACYAALSVLRIRTFLEHQAHERASGRSVIIEDRGPLAFLFLNNNYHVVHHMHPRVSWHKLPAIYRARQARFVRMNQGYVYRSYSQVFAKHLFRCKDPVAHPLWQRPKK
ncbi:MAG: fatty acid desaturase [Sulfitobacter sp.]|nr:fatty acid desaturase [Sulfitobacter sp.]